MMALPCQQYFAFLALAEEVRAGLAEGTSVCLPEKPPPGR